MNAETTTTDIECLKENTLVKYVIDGKTFTGRIKGISNNAIPGIGLTYIVDIGYPYPYTYASAPACILTIVDEPPYKDAK
jgi:hypothetical protein